MTGDAGEASDHRTARGYFARVRTCAQRRRPDVLPRADARADRFLRTAGPAGGAQAAGEIPARARVPAIARGQSPQRVVLEDGDKGAPAGLLAGSAVAVKDNICVAGVPMMNGSQLLEGYVPEIDATVVTRILEAGGTIAGKAACEDLCFSGQPYLRHRSDPQSPQPRTARADRPAAARLSSPPATSRWRSAATRAARSERRRAGVGSMA